MKAIAIFTILIGTVLLFGQLQAQVYTGPKITVTELNHDLGNVVQGALATQVFEVRNDGSGQLIIERVQTS